VDGQLLPQAAAFAADVAPATLSLVDLPVLIGGDVVELQKTLLPRRVLSDGSLFAMVGSASRSRVRGGSAGCDPGRCAVDAAPGLRLSRRHPTTRPATDLRPTR